MRIVTAQAINHNWKNASRDHSNNNSSHYPKEPLINHQDTNIIFNSSSIELFDAIYRLLNQPLNLAIIPWKLDITEV